MTIVLALAPMLSFGPPPAAATHCPADVSPLASGPGGLGQFTKVAIPFPKECIPGLEDCNYVRLSASSTEFPIHWCSIAQWMVDQSNLAPAYEVYHYQFPGCTPPACELVVRAWASQVDPDDPTAPFYKGAASSRCTADDICLVAEYGQAKLRGWNGTMSLECSPGSQSTSFLVPAVCTRGPASVGPVTTAQLVPVIMPLHVEFKSCTTYSFTQSAHATLIKGPLGETYYLNPETVTSIPRVICNNARSSAPYSGP